MRVFVYTESCAIFFKVSGRTFVYQWVSDKNPLLTPCFFFFRKAELSVPKFVTVSKMQTSMTCRPLDGVTENKENMMFCLLKITMR